MTGQKNHTRTAERGTGPEDQIMVQAAMRGEREAIDRVVSRLACVVRFVYRLNRSMGYQLPTEGLEDVVQQVHVALWTRLSDYAGTSALETWVYGFCRNCLRAEFRRRATRLRTVANDAARDRVLEDPGPAELAVQMESLDLLHHELEQLSNEDREIVELRHLRGRSFEQIARQKNLPPSTIKDRCYRAIERIRTRMKRRHGRA